MSKQPITILTKDKEFIERLTQYSNQYNKIQEELRKDYQNDTIPVLKEEFSLNRKWVNEKLVDALNQYKEFYIHRIAKQIELPADFSELMAPIFEVRKFKELCIASQAYEKAASYRDKELSMLKEPSIIYLVEEFNDAVSNELKGCLNAHDYYVSGSIFLQILETYLDSKLIAMQHELSRICSKWLLTEIAERVKLSNKYEHELALAMIAMKKLKWEYEITIK
jgi:hypothetical protein